MLQQDLLARYPQLEDRLTELGGRLTASMVHDLVSRIRMLKADPIDVARGFLLDAGLVDE